MKSRRLPTGCFISLGILCAISVAGYIWLQHANYRSALEATKEWARLNDFPPSATRIEYQTAGNMFSREFIVTFNADANEIDDWILESPGTADVVPETIGNRRKYTIQPAKGATQAELEVDDSTGNVKIHTQWS